MSPLERDHRDDGCAAPAALTLLAAMAVLRRPVWPLALDAFATRTARRLRMAPGCSSPLAAALVFTGWAIATYRARRKP